MNWCIERIKEIDAQCACEGEGIRTVQRAVDTVRNSATHGLSADEACKTLFMPEFGAFLGDVVIAAVVKEGD